MIPILIGMLGMPLLKESRASFPSPYTGVITKNRKYATCIPHVRLTPLDSMMHERPYCDISQQLVPDEACRIFRVDKLRLADLGDLYSVTTV
jgi:hypothetical protein